MRKYISIVEALMEATPVKPAQPVKPMKPGDARNNAQNTTAPVAKPQQQQQQAAMPDNSHKLPNGQRPAAQQQAQQALPNGQQEQPLQASGELQMGRDGKPLDPRDPAYDASLEAETDENGEPIDQQTADGLTAGEQAKQYLKKQGVIESVITEDAEADRLEWELTQHVITGNMNGGSYQGNPFWWGAVDIHSGRISDLHTYEYASDHNFEMRALLTGDTLRSVEAEESAIFYVGPFMNGTGPADQIVIDFEHGGHSGGPFLRRKLERMIRAQLD